MKTKKGSFTTNSNGAIKDVDPTDVIDVIKKVIKIFGDLRK